MIFLFEQNLNTLLKDWDESKKVDTQNKKVRTMKGLRTFCIERPAPGNNAKEKEGKNRKEKATKTDFFNYLIRYIGIIGKRKIKKVRRSLERKLGYTYIKIQEAFVMASLLLVLVKLVIYIFFLIPPFINFILLLVLFFFSLRYNLYFRFREFFILPIIDYIFVRRTFWFYEWKEGCDDGCKPSDEWIEYLEKGANIDYFEALNVTFRKYPFVYFEYYFRIFLRNIYYFFIFCRIPFLSYPFFTSIFLSFIFYLLIFNQFFFSSLFITLFFQLGRVFLLLSDPSEYYLKRSILYSYNIDFLVEKLTLSYNNARLLSYWSVRLLDERYYNEAKSDFLLCSKDYDMLLAKSSEKDWLVKSLIYCWSLPNWNRNRKLFPLWAMAGITGLVVVGEHELSHGLITASSFMEYGLSPYGKALTNHTNTFVQEENQIKLLNRNSRSPESKKFYYFQNLYPVGKNFTGNRDLFINMNLITIHMKDEKIARNFANRMQLDFQVHGQTNKSKVNLDFAISNLDEIKKVTHYGYLQDHSIRLYDNDNENKKLHYSMEKFFNSFGPFQFTNIQHQYLNNLLDWRNASNDKIIATRDKLVNSISNRYDITDNQKLSFKNTLNQNLRNIYPSYKGI